MKQLLLCGGLLVAGSTFSQIFSESFDTEIPATWTIHDEDGLASSSGQAAYASWAWNSNANDASSSSWYDNNGSGPTDDWLVTPGIAVPAAGSFFLEFDASSHEANYLEEYEVLYSLTGSAVADFTAAALLSVTDESATGTARSVAIPAAASGQTIYIAFHHISSDESMLHIDNVVVREVLNDDASAEAVNLARYANVSTNNTLSVDVKNVGGNDITSLEINWNDGTDHIQTITQTITPGNTVTIDHPDVVTAAVAEEKNITVTISQVNGGADADPSNNDGAANFNTVSSIVQKNVVIEEGTGTWCGWCPRGAVAMDYMAATYPTQFIGVAVHNGDPMTVTEYDNGAGISGFPGANVDRVLLGESVSQAGFEAFFNARKDLVVPAGITATRTVSGNDLTIDVAATFVTPFAAADYRLAVVMVEDHVTGTTSAYNQANYYAGGGSGVMGGYENLADPVPAADMVYDHVGRALLGGYDGQAGSVPAVITDGAVANYTFNYTVPATSTVHNMHAVALLIDQSNGAIVNAAQVAVSEAGIAEGKSIELNVYPNPADNNVNVAFEAAAGDYTISITDMAGRVVSTNAFSNLSGAQTIAIPVADLESGNYVISVANNAASYNQVLVIK